MKNLILGGAAIAALAFVGCSKDDVLNASDVAGSAQNEIKFSSYANATTKGAPITGNDNFATVNGGKFSVAAYLDGSNTRYLGGFADGDDYAKLKTGETTIWEMYSGVKYWPESALDFYALVSAPNEPTYDTASGLTFSEYTTPAAAADQKDFMYATALDQTKTADGLVGLTFKHAFTQLQIKMSKQSNDFTLTVNSARLHNIKSVGTFSLDEAGATAWTAPTTPEIFTLNLKDAAKFSVSTTSEFLTDVDDASMFIPQSFTAWDGASSALTSGNVFLELNCTATVVAADGTEVNLFTDKNIYAPIPDRNAGDTESLWQMGNRVIYNIQFTNGTDEEGEDILVPILFDVDVENWNDEFVPGPDADGSLEM